VLVKVEKSGLVKAGTRQVFLLLMEITMTTCVSGFNVWRPCTVVEVKWLTIID